MQTITARYIEIEKVRENKKSSIHNLIRYEYSIWCGKRIDIRTQARFRKLGESDCFCDVLVMKRKRNPIVIDEN